ncbi:MAG TPA: cation:proton antiporter [Candidatus Polarisedimenticolia bacterium]|nr:cation:proton antiporter [Candidatus Polarisedimenticolia bacterium]
MAGVAVNIFGIIGLLTLVGFLPALSRRVNLPYTVLLAVVGLGLGGLILATRNVVGMGPLSDFLQALRGFAIPADAFLAIFLPTLLFETALAIDIRQLMDDVAPILLMAVVAVLVSAFCVGLTLAFVFSISIVAALLLGSIVSTTDPVAVVGIFRDLGAPKRLGLLVEGESLFNDAAAIALYGLLIELLLGEHGGSAGRAVVEFLRDFIGGAVFGWAAAWAACALARPLRGLPQAEITLTVALAYLVYLFAEHYLGVSGVVSVVVAALTLSAVGRTRFTPTTWDRLENIWQQLGFWANSLIFLLAAMLVPKLVDNVTARDAMMLGVLVIVALAARFVVVFGLFPLLNIARLAERIDRNYGVVIVWGGLRGAVSLALGLAVAENDSLPPELRHMVGVLTTGFVLFTLLINGISLRPLIKLLGLDRLAPAEQALRDRALTLALEGIKARLSDVAIADKLASRPVSQITEEYDRRIAAVEAQGHLTLLKPEDLVYIGLRILVNHESELALTKLKDGILPRSVADALIAGSALLGDAAKTGGSAEYEKAAAAALAFPRSFRFALWLHHRWGIERPLASALAERFERLLLERLLLVELGDFVTQRLQPILGIESATALTGVLSRRGAGVEQALAALRLQYPDYAEMLEGRYLGRVSLRLEEDSFRSLLDESVVSQEIFNDLDRRLSDRRRNLERRPGLDVALDSRALIAKVPLFMDLPADRQAAIARLLSPRLALPGERIVTKGERGDAMYFIASGAAAVSVGDSEVRLGSGEFFGEIALIAHRPRTADVTALGFCRLLTLNASDFNRLLAEDPELKEAIDSVARHRLAQN